MSSSALSIAVSALRAHTYAVETTSHNIANAATPGYRRQRVELRAAYPRAGALGPMGAGVEAIRITQATDRLADLRVRGASSQASYFGVRGEVMNQAERIFGEPDGGVAKQLASTWQAFATLSVQPSDNAARYEVLSSLNSLAARVNDIRTGLDQLQTDATGRLDYEVSEVNLLSARLAEINKFARTPGGLSGDLSDERDRTIDILAETVGAQASIDDVGRVRVTINGLAIVDDERSVALTVPGSPVGAVFHPAGPIRISGTVGGLQAAVTTDVADARAQLDNFVTGFMDEVNALHTSGFTPAGDPGGPLLGEVNGKVTVLVAQPEELAATDEVGQALNGKIFDSLSQLRESQGGVFRGVVTSLSGKVAGLGRSADTAQSVADAASAQRDSIVGVNIDEEMTDLIGQQRAYDAAARLVSVIDDMLLTLIQM